MNKTDTWWQERAEEFEFKSEKDFLTELYEKYSTYHIAHWLRVCPRTITNRMDRYGIPRNPRWYAASKARKDGWEQMAVQLGYDSEKSMWQVMLGKYKTVYFVAKEMQLVDSTVRQRMRIYGLVRQNIPRQKGEIE